MEATLDVVVHIKHADNDNNDISLFLVLLYIGLLQMNLYRKIF